MLQLNPKKKYCHHKPRLLNTTKILLKALGEKKKTKKKKTTLDNFCTNLTLDYGEKHNSRK